MVERRIHTGIILTFEIFFKNMPNLLPEEIDIQSLWVFFSQIIGKELQKLFSIFKMLQK